MKERIFPFLGWFKDVNSDTVRADLGAGLTGAIMVLPQGVAFAMIAGMPPIYGLYSAMIIPIVVALFGSSYHMISGPATAISIVVYSAVSQYAEADTAEFVALAFTMTFIVGIMQLAMGFARLGAVVNFVSHTVIIGFTAGAALLIGAKQLEHCFGVDVPEGAMFHEIFVHIGSEVGAIQWPVVLVALVTLAVAILLKKLWKRSPNLLIAMIAGSFVSIALGGEEAGIQLVGEMDGNLPPFNMPDISFSQITDLAPNAFAIALLGLIEAVAIAKAIGIKTGQKINSNQEFIGQGLSHVVGSFFSCFPGSGSFTRSGINYDAGAKTPMAGILAAVFLGVILLFVAPYTAYLPIPAMGGIILLVGYNLIDFKHIRQIMRISGRESAVLVITFLATLFLQLEFAIYLGVIFSLIFYLLKTSKPRIVPLGILDTGSKVKIASTIRKKNAQVIPGIKMVRLDGSMYFGSVEHIDSYVDRVIKQGFKVLIIDGSGINTIDMSGADLLVRISNRFKEQGGGMIICNLKRPVRLYLMRGEYWKDIGVDKIRESEWDAIDEGKKLLSASSAPS